MLRRIALAGLCAVASSAMAAQVSYTNTYSGIPALSGSMDFAKFDSSLGTLTGVTIQAQLISDGGALRVDNDSLLPASGDIYIGATLSVSSPSGGVHLLNASAEPLFPAALESKTSAHVDLTGDDGDGTGFQSGGGDYGNVVGGVVTTYGGGNVGSSYFADYTGSGNFTLDYSATQLADYGSLGGASAEIDALSARGYVSVIYDYTPVPEPAALVAPAIAAGLVFSGRWRGRAKR